MNISLLVAFALGMFAGALVVALVLWCVHETGTVSCGSNIYMIDTDIISPKDLEAVGKKLAPMIIPFSGREQRRAATGGIERAIVRV